MVLNLSSSSLGARDGGVGGGETLMAGMEMRCPTLAEWNGLKRVQDCDERTQIFGRDWMSDLKERKAGLWAYIYGLRQGDVRRRTSIKEVAPRRLLFLPVAKKPARWLRTPTRSTHSQSTQNPELVANRDRVPSPLVGIPIPNPAYLKLRPACGR